LLQAPSVAANNIVAARPRPGYAHCESIRVLMSWVVVLVEPPRRRDLRANQRTAKCLASVQIYGRERCLLRDYTVAPTHCICNGHINEQADQEGSQATTLPVIGDAEHHRDEARRQGTLQRNPGSILLTVARYLHPPAGANAAFWEELPDVTRTVTTGDDIGAPRYRFVEADQKFPHRGDVSSSAFNGHFNTWVARQLTEKATRHMRFGSCDVAAELGLFHP